MSGSDSDGTSKDVSITINDTNASINQICYYTEPHPVPTTTDIGIYLLAFIILGFAVRKLYIVKL